MFKKITLIAAFLLSTLNIFATTYYVDNTGGNDANNGTSTTSAWKSISKVNSKSFSPGDFILFKRGGVWNQQLTVSSSGSSTAPIVYGSYGSGVLPVIDGKLTLTYCGYSGGKSYVTFREMKFQNALGSGSTLRIQDGTGLRVENCEFYITAHGGVFLQNTTNAVVFNNKMTTPAAALAAQTDGIYIQRTTGTIVDGNNIVISNTDPNPHCDGIQGYQDNSVTIRNNYFEQNNLKTANAQGIYVTECSGSSTFYNNVVNCPNTKASVIGFQNITTSGHINVYNNTAISGGTNGLYVMNDPSAIVKNNIFISKTSSPAIRFSVSLASTANLNNNLYYRAGGTGLAVAYFDNLGNKTLAQLKSMGAESKGKEADPRLNTDFTPSSTSPSIDGGLLLGGIFNVDKIGTPRPQGVSADMGAYEYKSTTSITSPSTTASLLKAYAYTGTLAGSAAKKTFTGSKGAQVIIIPDNTGSAKYTFNIPTSGTWYLWGRLYYNFATPSGCNSFSARIDANALQTLGNSEIYTKWNWDGTAGAKLSLGTVAAGTHTITILNRESSTNVMLDMIVLSNDPNYVPTDADFGLGKGDNEQTPDSTQTTEVSPDQYTLGQNYPNPFNPSTVIKFALPVGAEVSVKVYDILGAEVATLASGMMTAGTHTVNFNGTNLASGTYIYTIRTKDFFETKKMMLVK